MAYHSGNNGVIKAITTGGTPAAVGEVKSFDLNINADRVEVSSIGDTWKGSISGLKSWEVSLTCNYDPSDAPQADLIENATVDLELFASGETSGYEQFSGTAIVNSVSIGVSENEAVSYEVTLTGDGALTRGTVA
jgi:predicted secreted protein